MAHHAASINAGQADVVIIGGGPAGSTAAILLAEKGYDIVLLEKSHHPRFHIGESLLPANLPLFERLGVAAQIREIGMQKIGAEFVSPSHGRGETFLFAEAWNKAMPFAYQVRRSAFDEILIRRAAQCGVAVVEGCRARNVDLQGVRGRVAAALDDGSEATWDARFVIDASGRDTLIASQIGAKRRNKKHSSAAMYAHFRDAERYSGSREGLISLYWFEHGWFWFIPLPDGATSVGAVVWPYYLKSRRIPVREFFLDTIGRCAPLAQRLAAASLISDVQATGNYSYQAKQSHGDNYLLLGDAFAFIDPVFSSGVWLAMHSAVAGAQAVDSVLEDPSQTRAALRRFDRSIRRGPRKLSWLIYRVSAPAMRELFMRPRNLLRTKEAILSLLAGDIFDETPIWASIVAFRALYTASSLLHLRRAILSVLRRRRNISDEPAGMESSS